jgi:uncharacterized protein with von Willebrand factor type A (vWA) domain
LTSIVDTQRSKLFARIDESGFLAEIQLPPAVVEIVDASSSLSDLIPAALKLRTAYRELRKWVGELQSALEEEDVQAIIARRKLLQSVSRHIDQLSSQTTTTWDVSIRIGLSWPNIAVNVGRHLNAVHNKIGIRAQINRLIITPPGRRALTKLSKLLGHGDSDALLNAFRSTQLQM